jgi:hypothetical protein
VSAVRWAHHRGFVADTVVTAWALATISALGLSTWSVVTTRAARALAKLDLTLACLSLVALAIAGFAVAGGFDAGGACGGG